MYRDRPVAPPLYPSPPGAVVTSALRKVPRFGHGARFSLSGPRAIVRTLACIFCLAGAACARGPATAREQLPALPGRADSPTLVVFFTVDQLRGDYFDRFQGTLTGGLARLAAGGALFTNGHHDHAVTETAPGHASTMSGRFPRRTGIVRNSAGVQDSTTPLIGASAPGASPHRFRGSTLTDWLRKRDARSRTLSVSRKDRGAILPVGRSVQHVYWYAEHGDFTTSTYYRDTLPAWVRRFNERGTARRLAGQAWMPLLPDSAYPEPDSVAVESGGKDFVFPHVLPADPAEAARALPGFPWMDSLTLELALEGTRALDLGAGPQTDVLAISLSTTDAVGHRYGPDSKELHDQIVRLDRLLGAFLDSLYAMRDSTRIVIALTGDHGVAPFPAVQRARRGGTARHVDVVALESAYQKALGGRRVDTAAVSLESGMLFVDRAALARANMDADSLVRACAAAARAVPGIMRVDAVRTLAQRDTAGDAIARRWYHALPPGLPVALVLTLAPYNVWAGAAYARYAQHGSPHDYDTHVPILFYGRPFRPGRYTELVRVVDMAPTLAWVTGAQPTEQLDGQVLRQALRDDRPPR